MRPHEDRQKFLEILEDVPLVSVAAKRAGVGKSTIYRWRHDSKSFATQMDKALTRGRETVNDLAESQLVNLIRKGDFKSVKYWLDNNKKEYARPRPKSFWEEMLERESPITGITFSTADPEKIRKEKEALRAKQINPGSVSDPIRAIKFTVVDSKKDNKEKKTPDKNRDDLGPAPAPSPSRNR